MATEGEAQFLNGPFNRHVALALIAPGKRMTAHEQQVKAQQGQAKTVVIRATLKAVKGFALQLRRGELRDANIAGKQLPVGADLERITVNQLDQRLRRDDDIARIDIADDMAASVNRLKGAGEIAGGMRQKRPVGVRKGFFAMRRAVEAMDFPVAADLGHDEALHRAIRAGAQQVYRPGGNVQQTGMSLTGHAVELEGLVGVDRLVINLGDEARPPGDFMDCAFAAAPQRLTQVERLTGSAIQPRHAGLPQERAGGNRPRLERRPHQLRPS